MVLANKGGQAVKLYRWSQRTLTRPTTAALSLSKVITEMQKYIIILELNPIL